MHYSPDVLWEMVGSLEDMEALQVLTNLFHEYEKRLELSPDDEEATRFFQALARAVDQAQGCNLNRR